MSLNTYNENAPYNQNKFWIFGGAESRDDDVHDLEISAEEMDSSRQLNPKPYLEVKSTNENKLFKKTANFNQGEINLKKDGSEKQKSEIKSEKDETLIV